MATVRLYASRFTLGGQLDNFTSNLCGSKSAKAPTASSPASELAPELARPRQTAVCLSVCLAACLAAAGACLALR